MKLRNKVYMKKEDIKKSVLTGMVSGFTAAVTILVLLWSFIIIEDWYTEYKREKSLEEVSSTPPNKSSGVFCPKCTSTDVGEFFYGLYRPEKEDSATIEAVKNNRLIPGGCVVTSMSPKYRCNSCSYTWGHYDR